MFYYAYIVRAMIQRFANLKLQIAWSTTIIENIKKNVNKLKEKDD